MLPAQLIPCTDAANVGPFWNTFRRRPLGLLEIKTHIFDQLDDASRRVLEISGLEMSAYSEYNLTRWRSVSDAKNNQTTHLKNSTAMCPYRNSDPVCELNQAS